MSGVENEEHISDNDTKRIREYCSSLSGRVRPKRSFSDLWVAECPHLFEYDRLVEEECLPDSSSSKDIAKTDAERSDAPERRLKTSDDQNVRDRPLSQHGSLDLGFHSHRPGRNRLHRSCSMIDLKESRRLGRNPNSRERKMPYAIQLLRASLDWSEQDTLNHVLEVFRTTYRWDTTAKSRPRQDEETRCADAFEWYQAYLFDAFLGMQRHSGSPPDNGGKITQCEMLEDGFFFSGSPQTREEDSYNADLVQLQEQILEESFLLRSQDGASEVRSGESSPDYENKIVERLSTRRGIIRERSSGEPIQRSGY